MRVAWTFRPARLGAALAALALAAGLTALPADPAAAAPAAPSTGSSPNATGVTGSAVTVTLVTGDRVTVGATDAKTGRPAVTIQPVARPGRVPGFRTRYDGDHVYVIPDDVADLVPDVLDEGLFDVTGLAAAGYDDSRPSLPLIVRSAPGVRQVAAPAGLRARLPLPSIHATAMDLDTTAAGPTGGSTPTGGTGPAGAGPAGSGVGAAAPSGAQRFGALLAGVQSAAHAKRAAVTPKLAGDGLGGIGHVWLDGPVTAAELDANLTRIGAPAAWQAGLSGGGAKVAVLDTGIDAGHPDLAGQVDASVDFTGTATDPGTSTDDDDNGHGTHVASLIAGTGAAADGARRGVAYGARLYAGKVLDADGRGQQSWLIAGMQWAVAQGSTVVNLSLGSTATGADDPVVDALDELAGGSGTLFVVAAGNSGSGTSTVESPGTATDALTVGAVTAQDGVAFFSSRGPTRGDYRLKPDITAPGVAITGALAGARGANPYTSYTGTSQATPQVAGAAAILRAAHPDWTAQRVKATLVGAADPATTGTVWDQGGGRLDLSRATTATLTATVTPTPGASAVDSADGAGAAGVDVAGVDFGMVRWPDRGARSQRVTFTNSGTAPSTVELAAALRASTGTAAPAGLLDVSPGTLTVPAGGTATATVTLHPDAAPAARYGGLLTATGPDGAVLVRLPVNGYLEPERYDVHLSVLDRHGDPYAGGGVDLVNADNVNGGSYFNVQLDADGTATVRVAPGWYGIQSRVSTPTADGGGVESVAFAGDPEVRVAADTTVAVDARRAQPLRAPTVPHVATTLDYAGVLSSRFDDHQGGYTDTIFPAAADITAGAVLVQPTRGPVTHGIFEFTTRWRLLPVTPRRGQPDLYDLVLPTDRVPDPPAYPLSERDVRGLARLDVDYHAAGPATSTVEARYGGTGITVLVGAYRPVALPAHRLELLSAGVRWSQLVEYPSAAAPVSFIEPDTTYRPGQRVAVHWLRSLQPQVVEAPRYPTNQWFTTGLSDGEHTGRLPAQDIAAATLDLSRNGSPVGERAANYGYFTVPDGPAAFTAAQSLALTGLPTVTGSRTVWTFGSAPPADPTQQSATVAAAVTLDVVPALDAHGRAPANRPLAVTVVPGHLAGSTAPAGGFRDVRLWLSPDNGTSWLPVPLLRGPDGRYRTVVPPRLLRHAGPVALRSTARDAAGATIDRTVATAFTVR